MEWKILVNELWMIVNIVFEQFELNRIKNNKGLAAVVPSWYSLTGHLTIICSKMNKNALSCLYKVPGKFYFLTVYTKILP